jgi:signal transduction histidine kinase/DNA-binding NarL/FixJ family response regulator
MKKAIKYKPLLFGAMIAILLFLGLYFAESWGMDLPGVKLNNGWKRIENTHSAFDTEDSKWIDQSVPFHDFTEKSYFINLKYVFDGKFKYLVLPFISSNGFRVSINETMIDQIGDIKNGTANVWNHVHLIDLDQNLLKEEHNEIRLELFALYTYGIEKAPLLTNFDNTYSRVYIQNIFRTYLPFISIGASLILGIILIVLGVSDKKTRKLFFYLGFCMFFTAIFLFDERFRITTGSLDFFLIFRKFCASSGFMASWFLLAAMEIYTTGKSKLSKILLVANLSVILFAFIQPSFYDLSNWLNTAIGLNIINIFSSILVLFTHLKSREWLFMPIFFMCLTFIHYLVTWHIMRFIGPNLTDIGLIFGSLGFGLILIVQFRHLLKQNTEMEKKNYELELQKNEALKLAHIKSDTVAQTSHEIRNPLMGIIGMSEFLLTKDLDKETINDIRVIKSCSMNLREILNDILDSAKIDAGKFELHDERFSINDVLEELNAIYSILAEQKQLKWSFIIKDSVPKFVICDRIRITQILNNLLSNAIKFTDSGEMSLVVSERENELIFTISDTGSGINKELQETIFDPYSQLENSNHIQGTGLGLSIVKKLVKIFKGRLNLESEINRGSKFTIFIPYKKTAGSRNYKQLKQNKQFRILIADDNRINVRVLKYYLREKENYKVSTAFDGKDTLKKLENNFDIIVMDLNMPLFGGVEIVKKIRKSGSENADSIFIAITGENVEENEHYLLNSGFNIILRKPVLKKQFLNIFEKITTENFIDNSSDKLTALESLPEEIVKKINDAELDSDTIFLIIHEFLKETPDNLKKLKEAIEGEDYKTIYEKAHYFKSSLDYLGTEKAAKLRKLIEDSAQENETSSIALYFNEFSKEIERLLSIFQRFYNSKNITR